MKSVAGQNGLIILAAPAVIYDSASAQSPPAAPAPASLSFGVVVGPMGSDRGAIHNQHQ